MATGGDVKGILDLTKFQAERGEDIALKKYLKQQQLRERKLQKPAHISREVFALMTEEELAKLYEEQQ